MNHKQASGVLFFIGAVQFIVGMNVAEFLYPGYSVSNNYISDLGILQPSASIFNASVIILGLLILLSSYFIRLGFNNFLIPLLFAIAGIGAIGVGLFPEDAGEIHVYASFITFLFGGLAAVASYSLVKKPFSYFSVLLGMTSLTALVLFGLEIYLGLGAGGMERMIVYPLLAWAIGFGGYLMSSEQIA